MAEKVFEVSAGTALLYPLHLEWCRDEDGYIDNLRELMEFRLVYEGPLKASGNASRRVSEKHAIRKVLHKQLKELWDKHPAFLALKEVVSPEVHEAFGDLSVNDSGTDVAETLARKFDRCGFRFVPLVNHDLALVCSLDILFLRRENPGALISSGGDVDNRIKTLFDALRIPEHCGEVQDSPEEGENPFFCLLENDSLITGFNVTTDRLLTPLKSGQHENEVVLIIQVKIKGTIVSFDNMHLLT